MSRQFFAGPFHIFNPVPRNEEEAVLHGNALAASGNYPVGTSECFNVGISGGCGKDCFVYLKGECSEPGEMIEQLTGSEEVYRHHDLYPSDFSLKDVWDIIVDLETKKPENNVGNSKVYKSIFRKGFTAGYVGMPEGSCPYEDIRTSRGGITFSRSFINCWQSGWRVGTEYTPMFGSDLTGEERYELIMAIVRETDEELTRLLNRRGPSEQQMRVIEGQ